ncbi:hypothetical protein AAF712_009141 [Marasmius tenuissimus]|uniref:Flavin-containing monooxygenase n=1 Tax=Marasmius tenuissimus TaxID=585030 RepID=A0ABR2ZQJ8_9AGAR
MPSKDSSTSDPPSLPPHHPVPDSTKSDPNYPSQVAREWLTAFSSFSSLENLFIEDSFWRDIIALSSDVRTFRGYQAQIKPFIETRARSHLSTESKLELLTETAAPIAKSSIVDVFPDLAFLQFAFKLRLSYGGKGSGIARLVYTGNANEGVKGWKAFTVFTCLDELDGVVEPVGQNRPVNPITEPWSDYRKAQNDFVGKDPEVLVIGAGQTGLEMAARLKLLGVRTLVIERNERVGDNWRKRYDSLALHDTAWYDTPPYLMFPSTWPVYCSGGKLANFLEMYAETLELTVWTSTNITATSYDQSTKVWSVDLSRGGEKDTVKVKHIVFGTGFGGGIANIPVVPGADKFKGTICHSSQFKSARNHTDGGKAVVVGACNSGHDIAQDFVQHGVDVTMYQRDSTYVISAKGIRAVLDGLYNESTLPYIDWSDRVNASMPYPLVKLLQQRVVAAIAGSMDKELLDGLASRGFKANLGPDGAGVFPLLFEKAGGYYLDTGGSQDIIDGKIKLISGAGGGIKHFTPDGLVFNDGTQIDGVSTVVFATGFGDSAGSILPFLPEELRGKLKPIWGLNEEGELNSVWRESGVPGVWVGVGNLAMCRYWSGVLALQIKSDLMGGVLPEKY